MPKRLWVAAIGLIIVIITVIIQYAEGWTLVRHTIEALKSHGPVGVFLADILLSRSLPLVLVLVSLLILAEIWRKQRELDRQQPHEKAVSTALPAAPTTASAEVKDSGNSNATATGNTLTVLIPQQQSPVPTPSFPVHQEEDLPVNVEFAPWEGQFEKMYLTVKNRGAKQSFQAQCRTVGQRNDANPRQVRTFNLNWEYGGRALQLMPGESGNLLIASAGEDRTKGTEWMKLESASVGQGPSSHWLRGAQKLPEYDIEITILGQKSNQPQTELFTVRAGTSCALEMYHPLVKIETPIEGQVLGKREIQVSGSVTIPRARMELRVFAGGRWHHNGYWYAQGHLWTGTCWLGNKDSIGGNFTIVAIADGDMDVKQKYATLPKTGCQSNAVTVTLKRTISESRLADLRSKVNIVSLLPDPKRIHRGNTLKIRYSIESLEDVASNVWFEALLFRMSTIHVRTNPFL
jgi:hypothetical protein